MLHGLMEFADAFPDWTVEVVNVVASGPYVATEWKTTGTHEGMFRGESPTGIRFRREGCSVAEVEGGKIVRYRDYYDRATLPEQLGLTDVL
jgi:predicted ester cyclase